jgi:hypothetical protein
MTLMTAAALHSEAPGCIMVHCPAGHRLHVDTDDFPLNLPEAHCAHILPASMYLPAGHTFTVGAAVGRLVCGVGSRTGVETVVAGVGGGNEGGNVGAWVGGVAELVGATVGHSVGAGEGEGCRAGIAVGAAVGIASHSVLPFALFPVHRPRGHF